MKYLKHIFEAGDWLSDLYQQSEWNDSWKDIVIDLEDDGFFVTPTKMFYTKNGNPLRDKASALNPNENFYQTTILQIQSRSQKNYTQPKHFIELTRIIDEVISRLSDIYRTHISFNNGNHRVDIKILLLDMSKPLDRSAIKVREKVLNYEQILGKLGVPLFFKNIDSLEDKLKNSCKSKEDPMAGNTIFDTRKLNDNEIIVTLKNGKYKEDFENIVKGTIGLRNPLSYKHFGFSLGRVNDENILIYKGKKRDDVKSIIYIGHNL